MNDSLQLGKLKCTLDDSDLLGKQDADVTLKEEVECTPESTQQLEPEFLNCAADVSSFKETDTIISTNTRRLNIENGEESNKLESEEVCTDQHSQIMAFKPQNSADVNLTAGKLSGITSLDGNTDMRSLSACCKKSTFFSEPQPQPLLIDSDKNGRNSAAVCKHHSTDDLPSNKCEDSKEGGGEEEDEVAHTSTYLLSQKPANHNPELLNQSVRNGDSVFQTTETTPESKDASAQQCTLGKTVSLDLDEDIYRDEDEIEKEKTKKGVSMCEKGTKDDPKLGVGPEVDIIEYCKKEWRGKTPVAKQMREGYEEVSHYFGSIRQVRGDNYCALRATLFQCLSQATELPRWLDDASLFELPEKLYKTYDWINLWRFWSSSGSKAPWLRIKECLELLKTKWAEMSKMKVSDNKQEACDEIFQTEEEYCLYEAVKFVMLRTAVDLYNANNDGKEVPVFSWLLFARNTSNNPCEFMKNHLNQVGHSGGLEQVEMFLLGYALQHTIKVYRLYKYGTDEFITQYPDDQADWPVVTLITEDDRHYNVPVRMCEETSL
ncbi:ubiquitin thioesterase otulin isoform X1 [Pyxicephalus adspersus]|uniref:ubiquitin thioesterase otulin isoform X1 n=1 Tax=Pyxicephalus adspersus TaxID=30357 RepID=UPI003B5ADF95